MTTSVTRLGVAINEAELDSYLKRLSDDLTNKITALVGARPVSELTTSTEPDVPTVQGLRLNLSLVGSVGIQWNVINRIDLSHYSIDVSLASNFPADSSLTSTFQVSGTNSFNFTEAVQDSTYFFRVQAVLFDGTEGVFSSTLNSKTGKATPLHLEVGAATNPLGEELIFTTPVVLQKGGDGDLNGVGPVQFGSAIIETLENTVVLPFVVAHFTIDIDFVAGTNFLRLRLLRDGEEIDFTITDLIIDLIEPARSAVTGFATPHLSGLGGLQEYTLEYALDASGAGGNDIIITLDRQIIELVELRR